MKKIFFVLILLILLSGCNSGEFQKTDFLMDTYVSITVMSNNYETAFKAINASFDEMKRIEKIFNEFNNNSLIYELNKDEAINATDEIIYIINKSLYYSKITNGSFDITVKPILNLYKKTFKELKRPPTKEEIKDALKRVGYSKVIIKGNKIILNNTEITLGGIVKGYAIDRAIDVLKSYNISSALVNAGGDLWAYGLKNNKPWVIALANPNNPKEVITKFNITNMSVATSGNYERYFDKSKKFHHIVNPQTGYSAETFISLTVIAPKAIDADALATGCYVMGKEGLKLLDSLNLSYIAIFNNRTIIKSFK